MAQQLRRGAGQILEALTDHLDRIEELAIDNPQAVRKCARMMRTCIRDELYPMLIRAGKIKPNDQGDDERQAPDYEKRLARLEAIIEELSMPSMTERVRHE